MATVAHPRTSSNNQAGTRGLSAADWTRLKRLTGAKTYATDIAANTDVNVATVPQTPHSVPMLVPRHTGGSRIRRTNGSWLDYKASQSADYIYSTTDFIGTNLTNTNAKNLKLVRICNCTTTSLYIDRTGCVKCGVYRHKTIQ
jgi:hypothetical protein